MTLYESDNVKDYRPAPTSSQAGVILTTRGEYEITASLEANDLIALAKLPPEHVLVDAILDADDIDGGAGLTLTVGYLNALKTDLEASTELMVGETTGQAGGMARMDVKWGIQLAPSSSERIFAAKVVVKPAVAKGGTIGLTLMYRGENFDK